MGQCADCNGHVFAGMHHKCPVTPAPPVGDEAKHDDQAPTAAHVERLVAAELAHRKEIATLQAMVVELRGRLGEAERLLLACTTCERDDEAAYVRRVVREFLDSSRPDPPTTAYSAHAVQAENARAHAEESPPPVSTVDSRIQALEAKLRDVDDRFNCNTDTYNLHRREHYALEARVAALEKLGKGEAPHAYQCRSQGVGGDGRNCSDDRGCRCRLCGRGPSIHAVPGAAK